MSGIMGAAIIVLGVLAALAVYVVAWRATRSRSLRAKALVRGGLGVLIAAPLAGLLLLRSEAPPAFHKIESQLSAERPEAAAPEPGGMGLKAPRKKADKAAPRRFKPHKAPGTMGKGSGGSGFVAPITAPEAMPDVAAPGDLSEPPAPPPAADGAPTRGPLIVQPPAAADGHPPAAADGHPEPEPTPEALSRDGSGASSATAPMAAKPADEQSDWDVVPVFYGTDRQEEPNPERLTYNAERAHRLELGRALVTVPKIHEVPQIERPWAIRIPYFDVTIYEEDEDPKKHFTMQEIKKLSKDEFLQLVRDRLKGSQRFKNHAIVFVHGYNTTFDNAVYRTAQISYDLKFDGSAFLYSWPSGGAVASYTYDRESAQAAEPYLRQFLELVIKETGAKSISVIAHSMGNQPLLDVLKDMNSAAPDGVVISQVILAAPDVDADNFANLARRIEGFAKGVTLYAASNDRALIISRNFWQNPRAGDVLSNGPLIVPGVDSIDVTAASTDAFALNHSGYAENNDLLQDIGKLILDGLRPPELRMPNLKRVSTDRGDYWRYAAP